MATEPLGFVVLDEDRYPMVLARDGVLWIAHRLWKVTAFATRQQAVSVISRTKWYARFHGYNWGEKYYIVRMVPFLRTPLRVKAVAKGGRRLKRPQQTKVRAAGKKKTTSKGRLTGQDSTP